MTACFEDILKTYERIKKFIHHTPVLTSATLNNLTGAEIFLKCENFQKVGAFKFRGAINAVLNLSDQDAACGVVTHSSGNHAQALSLAAKSRKIPAYIVMPRTSPAVKKAAVKDYGGIITFCEPTQEARESSVLQIQSQTNATLIHPFNNAHVIAGQATAALELLYEIPNLDAIITPVGGGGLLSGTALASKGLCPSIQVIGAEPKNANDAYKSLRDGIIYPSINPNTVADGLLTSLGDLTFNIIKKHVTKIITISEDEIISAMHFVWQRLKIIIEPSSAVAVAAVLNRKQAFLGQRVGIIISGGNVDIKQA